MTCKYCNDTGQITLFTTTVECEECNKPQAETTKCSVFKGEKLYCKQNGTVTTANGHGYYDLVGLALTDPDNDGNIEIRLISGGTMECSFAPCLAHKHANSFSSCKDRASIDNQLHNNLDVFYAYDPSFPDLQWPEGCVIRFNDGSSLYFHKAGCVWKIDRVGDSKRYETLK